MTVPTAMESKALTSTLKAQEGHHGARCQLLLPETCLVSLAVGAECRGIPVPCSELQSCCVYPGIPLTCSFLSCWLQFVPWLFSRNGVLHHASLSLLLLVAVRAMHLGASRFGRTRNMGSS